MMKVDVQSNRVLPYAGKVSLAVFSWFSWFFREVRKFFLWIFCSKYNT